ARRHRAARCASAVDDSPVTLTADPGKKGAYALRHAQGAASGRRSHSIGRCSVQVPFAVSIARYSPLGMTNSFGGKTSPKFTIQSVPGGDASLVTGWA